MKFQNKEHKNRDIESEYSIDFLAKFACLVEAVNITCSKAEQIGIECNTSSFWIKPIAFHKYMTDREKDMKYGILTYLKQRNETHTGSELHNQ